MTSVVISLQAVRGGVFGELQLVRDASGYLGEVFVPDPRGPRVVRGHQVDGVGFVPDHPLPLQAATALLDGGEVAS